MRRIACVGIFAALVLTGAQAHALDPTTPPNTWHPYQGGVNCIQVVDADANFNCFPGATINPVTGVVSGLSIAPGGGTFLKSVAIVPSTTSTTPQLLGSGDLVISTSPPTIASAGPRIAGVTIRVRQGPAGTCQLVVSAGDGFQEFIIPVAVPGPVASLNKRSGVPSTPGAGLLEAQLLEWFPGGNIGC